MRRRSIWTLPLASLALVSVSPAHAGHETCAEKECASEDQRKDNANAQHNGNISPTNAGLPKAPFAGGDQGHGKANKHQKPGGNDSDPARISAQAAERSANAAEWLNIISAGGLFIGLGTLAAAVAAATFARRAAIHTETAALEARRAADEAERSRRAFIARERAVFKPAERIRLSEAPNRPGLIQFRTEVQNEGSGGGTLRKMTATVSDDGDWPETFTQSVKASIFIKPDTKCLTPPIDLKPTSDRCFVLGFLEYETVSSANHTSYFCYEITRRHRDIEIYGGPPFMAEMKHYPKIPNDD